MTTQFPDRGIFQIEATKLRLEEKKTVDWLIKIRGFFITLPTYISNLISVIAFVFGQYVNSRHVHSHKPLLI